MTSIDSPIKIREGEEFDTQRVETFLKDTIPGLSGSIEVGQFPSGFSNLTYRVRVGDKKMVLRRPPFGTKAKTAHDMGREYTILKALKDEFPYCPKPLVYETDESIIGSPFYVMEQIEGIILRKDLPKGLTFSPDEAATLCERLIDVQVELHSIDFKKIGLENLGKPEGYVKRQVSGWSQRFRSARTPDVPDFELIMEWLETHQPPDSITPSLIHNDYRLDNVVLDPQNPLTIIGVLDWEMATIGDPLMDLGGSMAYWINRDDPAELQIIRLQPTTIEGALTRDQLVRYYEKSMGISISDFDFYYIFNLFRLATIAQQIYYRYFHDQTKDKRFGALSGAVQIIENYTRSLLP